MTNSKDYQRVFIGVDLAKPDEGTVIPPLAIAHVDYGLLPMAIVSNPRQMGKQHSIDVYNLLTCAQVMLDCIQNGLLVADMNQATIDICVEATDNLESAIQTLRLKGF